MFDDIASSALQVALTGLAARQTAIANNIANIQTPGFRAQKVQFETALQSALDNGTPLDQVQPTVATSLEPTRLDGNNVNLDEETLSNVNTGLAYQLALRGLDSKYNLLHEVIKG
ncbi:MAG TPA: flagellar basal body protein [Rugosimonospora sp.]|nr:flagellar basal body protein [Rugosimonospora sp.]